MERRKFILAIGGIASTGAAVGSGAFSSVEATRDVSVSIADDANAYLAMEPLSSPNGNQFASTDGEVLALDFSESGNDGSALGTDSVYDFDRVFQVVNQGTQGVYVWATFSGSTDGFDVGGPGTDIWLYADGDSDDKLRDSEDDVLYLSPGGSADIGVHVDTHDLGVDDDQTLTMTVRANVNNPAAGETIGGGGAAIDGPVDGLVSYWRLNDLDESGSGTTADAVGNYDGTVEGAVGAGDGVEGGGSAEFDGDDDVVSTDLNIGAAGESLTVSGWLKAPSDQGIGQNHFFLSNYIDRNHTAFFAIGSNDGNEMFFWTRDTEQEGTRTARTSDAFDGEWHHYVGVRDADTDEIRFYVDGSPVDTKSFPGDVAVRDPDSTFGMMQHYDSRYLERYADAVRVYDRALTDGEVAELHDVHDPSS